MEKEIIEKSQQEIMQDFSNEYVALCQKYGCEIIAQPVWIATNHGTYELSLQLTVVKK
jgi:hypothetical protein